MLVIHLVDESGDQPRCHRPERRGWLWSADPSDATCRACAASAGEPPAAGAPQDAGPDAAGARPARR